MLNPLHLIDITKTTQSERKLFQVFWTVNYHSITIEKIFALMRLSLPESSDLF